MKINWKKMKLTAEEKQLEREIERGEWVPVSKAKFKRIAAALERAKKDAVLNMRINSLDLAALKKKAKKHGVPYQSFVAELIHRYVA